jgi:lysophospholipase L1-like esterase
MPLTRSRRLAVRTAVLSLVLTSASVVAERPWCTRPAAAAETQRDRAVAAQPTPGSGASGARSARASGTRRTVVLIGDSTTYGTPPPNEGRTQSPYNPAAVLESLLATVEPPPAKGGTPWRGARVYDLAVASSSTPQWLADPPAACSSLLTLFPVVKKACAAKVPWVKAVPLAVKGRIDAVIVDLGINDRLASNDAGETVDRLVAIRDALAPIPVLLYPPIAPPTGPRGDWPQRVRAEMEKRGLLTEPQYPPYVPTFDGLHPTDGGYAAKAGLWLDGLRKLP